MLLVFCSSFVEGSTEAVDHTPRTATRSLESPTTPYTSLIMDNFEDSDGEDEAFLPSSLQPDLDNTELSESVADTSMLLDSTLANPVRQVPEGQSTDSDMSGPMADGSPRPCTQLSLHRSPAAPAKLTIVIRDVAYATYHAMLYYVGFPFTSFGS